MITIEIELSPSTHARVVAEANRLGITDTSLLEHIVTRYFEGEHKGAELLAEMGAVTLEDLQREAERLGLYNDLATTKAGVP